MVKEKVIIKEVEEGLDGAPPWITTFVDMISLLVTFFILLFTFSSIRDYDTFNVPQNIIGTAGTHDAKGDSFQAPDADLMLGMDIARGSMTRHTRPVDQLSESMEDMGQRLTEDHQEIDLRAVGDGIRVEFDRDAGFTPGGIQLNSVLKRALREMASSVRHYPLVVLIEGHTDNAFQPTTRYPDEHALAIARARAAAKYLTETGGFEPALVQISTMGSILPRNRTTDSALARRENRRVTARLVAMGKERAELHEKALGR